MAHLSKPGRVDNVAADLTFSLVEDEHFARCCAVAPLNNKRMHILYKTLQKVMERISRFSSHPTPEALSRRLSNGRCVVRIEIEYSFGSLLNEILNRPINELALLLHCSIFWPYMYWFTTI